MLQASSLGLSPNDTKLQNILIGVIEKKKSFTKENGAWNQYTHLAEWLIEIAAYINIKGTTIEERYLELAEYSYRTMSKVLYIGYSWEAYKKWKYNWKNILYENRKLLEEMIKTKLPHNYDAYNLITI